MFQLNYSKAQLEYQLQKTAACLSEVQTLENNTGTARQAKIWKLHMPIKWYRKLSRFYNYPSSLGRSAFCCQGYQLDY